MENKRIEFKNSVDKYVSTKTNNNNLVLKDKIKIRYNILDNIKGILIFLVVFAHFLFEYAYKYPKSLSFKIVNYIYGFHMPLFIFSSGFLSKSNNSRNFKNIIRLFLIYIIFNFSQLLILYKYKHSKINFVIPSYSYWYLLCLIYWRITIEYFSVQYFSILISLIISIMIGFSLEIDRTLSLKRTFSFYPFFLMGFKLSKTSLNKILEIRNKIYPVSLIFFFIFLYFSLKIIPFITIKYSLMLDNYSFKNYKEEIIKRIIIFIFSFLMILFNILLIPNKMILLLTKSGKNSLCIYLFHRIFTIIATDELFNKIKDNNYIILYSILFTIIILLIFGSNFFSKIINEFIDSIFENLYNRSTKGKIIGLFFSIIFIFLLFLQFKTLISQEKQK